MPRTVIAAFATLFLAGGFELTNSLSLAQGVGVGLDNGVHVRAPFVSVDVFPDGGVSVRAPFAAVDVGGRPYFVNRPIVEPSLPSPQSLATMDDDALLQSLRSTSFHLQQRLSHFDTGATWQRYLRLPEELVSGSIVDPDARRAAAAQLQQRFAEVAANERYRKVASLSAFQAMQAVLSEMNSRPASLSNSVGENAEELPSPQRNPSPNERSVVVPQQQ